MYNDKLGIRTRALLYGAGLPAKYRSAALAHLVYLHNCLVHNSTLSTPFGLYYGVKPDLEFLRTFGSRVCVKRSGDRRAKLDRHDFTGLFLGYTATDQNDLGVPQEAATILYEDNDACTAMANAQKPTPHTRHMDIKYFLLSEWVECDLMLLEPIDTSINLADHVTKSLLPALFHCHADFILGNIPPAYSPIYHSIIGSYVSKDDYIEKFVPSSFTTPLCSFQLQRLCDFQ